MICARCKRDLGETKFPFRTSKRRRRGAYCHECRAAYMRQWRKAKKAKCANCPKTKRASR